MCHYSREKAPLISRQKPPDVPLVSKVHVCPNLYNCTMWQRGPHCQLCKNFLQILNCALTIIIDAETASHIDLLMLRLVVTGPINAEAHEDCISPWTS